MTLTIRKLVVLAIVAGVFLVAHALTLAHWLSQSGAVDAAASIRREFLTGTAITVILALLILLVAPGGIRGAGASGAGASGVSVACPVCDRKHRGGAYCSHCGSKV